MSTTITQKQVFLGTCSLELSHQLFHKDKTKFITYFTRMLIILNGNSPVEICLITYELLLSCCPVQLRRIFMFIFDIFDIRYSLNSL